MSAFPLPSTQLAAWPQLRWAWTQARTEPGADWKRQWKFRLRTLLMPRASAQWFAFVRATGLWESWDWGLEFLELPHKPYLSKRWSRPQQLQALLAHHAWFAQHFSLHAQAQYFSLAGVPVARLPGKSGAVYELSLRHHGGFQKEGSLVLRLSVDGHALYWLACSVLAQEAAPALFVGAIQAQGQQLAAIRTATRDLHGIQPRILLIAAARELAQRWQLAEVLAVSSAQHIYRAARYQRNKTVQADYDALWQSVGGTQRADGLYTLGLREARIAPEERPANKRAEYRRRETLWLSLEAQIAQLDVGAQPPSATIAPSTLAWQAPA